MARLTSLVKHMPTEEEARTVRDRTLALVLDASERSWIVAEEFDTSLATWTFDLVTQTHDGSWRYRRFKHDVEVDLLYFWASGCRMPVAWPSWISTSSGAGIQQG